MRMDRPPLWRCPDCGRQFANRNQSHSCGRHSLSRHFKGKSPEIREMFDAVDAAAEAYRVGEQRHLDR